MKTIPHSLNDKHNMLGTYTNMNHQLTKYSSSNFLKSSSVKAVDSDSSFSSEDDLSVLHFTLLSKICKPQYKAVTDGTHHIQKIITAVSALSIRVHCSPQDV
jgi:hypothetical protein